MLKHYLTPAALALLDEIDWPTFLDEASGLTCCLCMYHGQICERIDGDMVTDPPAHVSLCLLRNHLREYATGSSKGRDVRRVRIGLYYVATLGERQTSRVRKYYIDIDAALLAAAAEAAKKGK